MTYFKKIYVAIILLSISSIGYAYDNCSSFRENENCFPCQPVCCSKGFINAELIYWRAFESGLDICVPTSVSDTVTPGGRVISNFRGKSRDLHFKWDPGFRIGAGYELACDWDIIASWSHIHSHANGPRNRGNHFRWNINFNVIDAVAVYESGLSSCFDLWPFVGIRGAKIDQRLRLRETSISTSSSLVESVNILDRNNKEKFSGAGPLLGVEAEWNIGCGLSLYTSASISWLYGNFDIRLIETDRFVDATNFCRVKKRLDASLAGSDAGFGIRWKKCFCTNMQLFLQLGLEHHRYFDYNRIGNYGDLSFDGVNFSAGIAF